MLERTGHPAHWSERQEMTKPFEAFDLPEGVTFWSTPSHGYLRVDLRKHEARVSQYDYRDGPNHVLLEEDCSLAMWLAEHNLIPMEPYIADCIRRIPRETARPMTRWNTANGGCSQDD